MSKGEVIVLKKSDWTYSLCTWLSWNKIIRTPFEADSIREAVDMYLDWITRTSTQSYLDWAADDDDVTFLMTMKKSNLDNAKTTNSKSSYWNTEPVWVFNEEDDDDDYDKDDDDCRDDCEPDEEDSDCDECKARSLTNKSVSASSLRLKSRLKRIRFN